MLSNKKLSVLIMLVALPYLAISAPLTDSNPYLDWMFQNILVVMTVLVLVIVAYHLMSHVQEMTDYYQGKYLGDTNVNYSGKDNANQSSWFSKLYKKLWNLVPVEKEIDIQLDHNYDGIHELDNSLPPWWLYLFYFTIAISVVYLYIYEISDMGASQNDEYIAAMEVARAEKIYALSKEKDKVNEDNVTVTVDEEDLAAGENIYKLNCAACHGKLGEGTIGPNFVDKFWIHGGDIKDLYKVVYYGVPEKGMISWKNQLSPSSIRNVSSYILSLQGTNPPNQKDPQGVEY